MSGAQTHVGGVRTGPDAHPTLASDADRDRAADLLTAAFAEGCLTADEHAERARAVYAARTAEQLRELTRDLPGQDRDAGVRAAGQGTVSAADRCLMCMLLIVCPPAGIAWLLHSWLGARALSGSPVRCWRARVHGRVGLGGGPVREDGLMKAVPGPHPDPGSPTCC